jgi:hypothetical protein
VGIRKPGSPIQHGTKELLGLSVTSLLKCHLGPKAVLDEFARWRGWFNGIYRTSGLLNMPLDDSSPNPRSGPHGRLGLPQRMAQHVAKKSHGG